MEILKSYKNGNVEITLYDNGTRVMEYDETKPLLFDYPTSMDIKITNYCEGGKITKNGDFKLCQFCHEESNKDGKHANLIELSNILFDIPEGVEIALGGGNPLSHPNLVAFLLRCKKQGLIPNLTVNKNHLVFYYDLLKNLIDNKLIYGLGISIPTSVCEWNEKELFFVNYKHSVAHLIIGLHSTKIINILRKIGFKKFLLLGYKEFGRGIKYYNSHSNKINENIKEWENNILNILTTANVISFDNLSISQLNLQSKLPKKLWDKFYQGDDFSSTLYLDAVTKQFAPTSRSNKNERVNWKDISLLDYFRDNRRK